MLGEIMATHELVILGGMHPSQEAWAHSVAGRVQHQYPNTVVQSYEHWGTSNGMDIDLEAAKLAQHVDGWQRHTVVARSAGTWVVLKAIHEGLISPTNCILLGTAVQFGRDNKLPIDTWLQDYSVPTLFAQNTADPAIGFNALRDLLRQRSVTNATLLELPRSDHDYPNIAHLAQLISPLYT
jgi:hypothetical protein